MKKILYTFDVCLLLTTVAFWIMTIYVKDYWCKLTAIILLSTYYYSCIRPLPGVIIDHLFHNSISYKHWLFQERRFERKLYEFLKVKKWKNFMPTFKKEYFDLKSSSLDKIIGATCQAEIIHIAMLILSWLGLLFIIPFGKPIIYIIASSITSFFEVIFIIMQRYNRPRLVNLYEKKKKR